MKSIPLLSDCECKDKYDFIKFLEELKSRVLIGDLYFDSGKLSVTYVED